MNKRFTPEQEQALLLAVLQGSYLARHFPAVWLSQSIAKPKDDLAKTVQKLLRRD
jgi:hypothetical protein